MQVAISECIERYNGKLAPGDEPMTQARLATALGVTQGAVSRWANCTRPLTLDRLCKIAEVLHCSPDDLLKQAESMTDSHSTTKRGAA